jgi:hypothetical protein
MVTILHIQKSTKSNHKTKTYSLSGTDKMIFTKTTEENFSRVQFKVRSALARSFCRGVQIKIKNQYDL